MVSSITREPYQCEGCEKSIRADDYCRCRVGRQKEVDDAHAEAAQEKERVTVERAERAREAREWLAEREAWAASPEGIAEARELEGLQARDAAKREAAKLTTTDDGWAELRRQGAKDQADAAKETLLHDRRLVLEDKELAERERQQAKREDTRRDHVVTPQTPADDPTFADFRQEVTLLN